MSFTDELYNSVLKIWQKYLEHPFLNEMAQGELELTKFKKYMLQDYFYLIEYVKVYGIALTKVNDLQEINFWADNIKAIIDEINRVHIPYMEQIGIDDKLIESTNTDIVTLSYTNYMYGVASKGDELDSLIAILACSWSYAYISVKMVEKYPDAVHHPIYGEWFKSYICQEFQSINDELILKVSNLTANINHEKQEKLLDIFRMCSLYELDFWNMVYSE